MSLIVKLQNQSAINVLFDSTFSIEYSFNGFVESINLSLDGHYVTYNTKSFVKLIDTNDLTYELHMMINKEPLGNNLLTMPLLPLPFHAHIASNCVYFVLFSNKDSNLSLQTLSMPLFVLILRKLASEQVMHFKSEICHTSLSRIYTDKIQTCGILIQRNLLDTEGLSKQISDEKIELVTQSSISAFVDQSSADDPNDSDSEKYDGSVMSDVSILSSECDGDELKDDFDDIENIECEDPHSESENE